jgi:hypothetical protein
MSRTANIWSRRTNAGSRSPEANRKVSAAITLSPHNFQAGFHIRHAKRIMASLDDLEVQRVKPFERLCFVMYVVLYMIFVFMALSFVKLLTTPS